LLLALNTKNSVCVGYTPLPTKPYGPNLATTRLEFWRSFGESCFTLTTFILGMFATMEVSDMSPFNLLRRSELMMEAGPSIGWSCCGCAVRGVMTAAVDKLHCSDKAKRITFVAVMTFLYPLKVTSMVCSQ
jgi:hypothetical protein